MKLLNYVIILGVFFSVSSQETNAQFAIIGPETGQVSPNELSIDGMYLGKRDHYQVTALGAEALDNSITTTSGCTGIGFRALRYLQGINNTAIGAFALSGTSISSGGYNTAIGYKSSQKNTTGQKNVAIGTHSLESNTTGSENVAIGFYANFKGITGNKNIAIGNDALTNLTSGDNNIAIGTSAGVPNNTGSNQLNIQSVIYGINMSSAGNANVGIGIVPSTPLAKLEIGGELKINTVLEGLNSSQKYLFVDGDGIVKESTISSSNGSNSCFSDGNMPIVISPLTGELGCSQIYDDGTTVGVGVSSTATVTFQSSHQAGGGPGTGMNIGDPYTLYVNGWTLSTGYMHLSDSRLKTNITPIEGSISKIKKLSGYTYNWIKDDKFKKKLGNERQVGFIAQELKEVLPEAVVLNSDGYFAVNYDAVLPLLTEGIKEQQKEIEKQRLEIEELKTQLKEIADKIKQPQSDISLTTTSSFQINPNPVTNTSIVSYTLQNSTLSPYFAIYDLQGKLIKRINIPSNQKSGTITLKKVELQKGMYILVLINGNKDVESKKFIIS